MTRASCPACGEPARPRAPGLARCGRCGTWVRTDRPTERELAALYRGAWESPAHDRALTGGTGRDLAVQLAAKLRTDLGLSSFGGARILEVGAGTGELSRALAEAGAAVIAMDPFASAHLAGAGIPAISSWSELRPDRPFGGIVAIEVIEHTADPSGFLASCAAHLRPGGWLCLTTPNASGLHARLAGARWRELANPGHLQAFAPAGLERLLRNGGFRDIRRMRWCLDYGGTPWRQALRAVLQRAGAGGSLQVLAWKR